MRNLSMILSQTSEKKHKQQEIRGTSEILVYVYEMFSYDYKILIY